MMRRMMLIACLLVAPAAQAQVGNEGLIWRMGDPFVFCKFGLDKKVRAWFPISPYTGQFLITPGYCLAPVPNCGTYGKGWSPEEIASFFVMRRICPTPRTSGPWKDSPGDGRTIPYKH